VRYDEGVEKESWKLLEVVDRKEAMAMALGSLWVVGCRKGEVRSSAAGKLFELCCLDCVVLK
jgi:hypothetical protein